jgi:glycosyltransferase involved in cell wall biosynthesis
VKSICVLSHTGYNDSRALRTISTMAQFEGVLIDFYFIDDGKDYNKIQKYDNVNLFPIKEPILSKTRRIKNHSFIFFNSNFFIKEVLKQNKNYSIIYVHDLTTSYAGYRLKRTMNSFLIYDVHDLFIETINQFFPRSTTGLKKIIFRLLILEMRIINRFWEKKFFNYVDLTLTTNQNYSNYLIDQYKAKRILITPNYPELLECNKSFEIYNKLGIDATKKIILYHGALTEGRYLREIVNCAVYLKSNIELVIVGEGPLKNELVSLNRSNDSVHFVSFLPYEDLINFISGASLGLMLIEHINLSKKFALANKVTEYMAAGVPVFASNSPENVRIVCSSKAGFIHEFNDVNKLASELNEAINSSSLSIMGINGRKAFEQSYNWNVNVFKFQLEFEKILRNLK